MSDKLVHILFFALAIPNFASAKMYYVTLNVASSEQKCLSLQSNISCLTLSQYAKQPADYFASNTTLLFLPGNHTLESELAISSIETLTILWQQSGSETSTVSISCNSNRRFNFQSIEQVQIRGLKFYRCMNNEVRFVNNFSLDDCSFHGDWQAGSSISLNFVTVIEISGCAFSSNFGSEISDQASDSVISAGGALIVTDSETITISQSIFTDNMVKSYEHTNIAVYGGALFVATFYGSSKISVLIEDSVFENNAVIPNIVDGEGGAIYANGAILTVTNCTFINNSVTKGLVGKGGAIMVYLSTGTIENSSFTGNNVKVLNEGYGGAMHTDEECTLTITSCTFNDNFILSGIYGEAGAIDINLSFLTLDSTTFNGNRIASNTSAGGAVTAGSGILVIKYSNFIENSLNPLSNGYGGAITTSNCSVALAGVKFANNSILGGMYEILGGGVYFFESHTLAQNCVFDGNTVKGNLLVQGGALATGGSEISLMNCFFVNNIASDSVNFKEELEFTKLSLNDLEISTDTVNITNDTVEVYGGAIAGDTFDTVTIHSTNFEMNHVIASGDGGGGAISVFDVRMLTIINSSFVKNDVISDSDGGGGALNVDTGNVDISYSTFRENNVVAHTNGYGGAVFVKASYSESSRVILSLTKVTFTGNSVNSITNGYGGGMAAESGIIMLTGESTIFMSNNVISGDNGYGGGVFLMQTELNADNCDFSNNVVQCCGNHGKGGAMSSAVSKVSVINSKFINNTSNGQLAEGGAIFGDSIISLEVQECTLQENKAKGLNSTGGAIAIIPLDTSFSVAVVSINNSSFLMNEASADYFGEGGGLLINTVNLTVENCLFDHNSVLGDVNGGGGAVSVANSSLVIVESGFFDNFVIADGGSGGAIHLIDSDIVLNGIAFTGNFLRGGQFERQGGVIFLESVNLSSINFLKITNNNHVKRDNEGMVFALHSNLFLSGDTTIMNNSGSLFAFSSNVTFHGVTNITNNSFVYDNPQTLQSGGAVTAFQSNIIFTGIVNLLFNAAHQGGAILVSESKIYTYANLTISNNKALSLGGGIYAYQSELDFKGWTVISDNKAHSVGGGIDAVSSSIKMSSGTLRFSRNSAQEGGALHLEQNSKFYVIKNNYECLSKYCTKPENWLQVEFTDNSARRGGAIFVTDGTNSGMCNASPKEHQTASRECFFQALGLYKGGNVEINLINTFFVNNSATLAGGTIYGGLLDRCILSPLSELIKLIPFHNDIQYDSSSVKYILNVTNIQPQDLHSPLKLSSDPVRICFCRNNQPDCSYRPQAKYVKKGETFSVSLVAVDQFNNTISSTNIHASLSLNATLSEGQTIQSTSSNGSCTNLRYSVLSPRNSEQLVLFAEGPCSDLGISASSLTVYISPCPIGFEDSGLKCDCDPILRPDYVLNCSIDKEAVLRNGDVWISYKNTSDYEGYILHKHCPLDYCHPSTKLVYVNLNIEDGSDAQCAFNRSGKLCGSCKEGLSVVFGSSHCIHCSTAWVSLVVLFAIAGIVLILVLLILNLTVFVGTINGLIFYANIIAAYQPIFLPFEKSNAVTVFIAWLNLDLGFETCFIDGMNDYIKVWLQIVFPLYIIFLVIMVIIVAENSVRFTRILRLTSTNPIALLATLILLSYAKFIRIIIAAFSSATLVYTTDRFQEVVWLIDGNIRYGEGMHIPLLITALTILIIGLTYTLLLLLWSCRCPKSAKKVLTLTMSSFICPQLCAEIFKCKSELSWYKRFKTRLHGFIEVYEAPYIIKHRYWTGLLLLARIILYIFPALNIIDDPDLNLTFIIIIAGGIQVWSKLAGKIYKRWTYDTLESAYFFNLIMFALLTLYFRDSNKNQMALAYTSISIAFLTFLATVAYHAFKFIYKMVYKNLKENGHIMTCCWMRHKTNETVPILSDHSDSELPIDELLQSESVTEIDGNPPHEDTLTDHDSYEDVTTVTVNIEVTQDSGLPQSSESTNKSCDTQNQTQFGNELEELIDFSKPRDGQQLSNANANVATNATTSSRDTHRDDKEMVTVIELANFTDGIQ